VLSGFSGQSHLTREAQKLKTEQQSFVKQKQQITEAVNQVLDLVTNKKDMRSAIHYLAEMAGQDPNKVWTEAKTKMAEQAAELQNLTPEQIRIKEAEEELNFYRSRDEQVKTKAQKEADLNAVKEQVDNVIKKHGITEEDFAGLYQELVKFGKIPEDQITPQLIGEYHQMIKSADMTSKILKEVKSNPDTFDKDWNEFKKIALENPEFTEEDLRQIALEAYGSEPAKRLSKKLKKIESSPEVRRTRDPQKDPMFFDDL
jgi:hypothetical protein